MKFLASINLICSKDKNTRLLKWNRNASEKRKETSYSKHWQNCLVLELYRLLLLALFINSCLLKF